jgi:hypothetical protein
MITKAVRYLRVLERLTVDTKADLLKQTRYLFCDTVFVLRHPFGFISDIVHKGLVLEELS